MKLNPEKTQMLPKGNRFDPGTGISSFFLALPLKEQVHRLRVFLDFGLLLDKQVAAVATLLFTSFNW